MDRIQFKIKNHCCPEKSMNSVSYDSMFCPANVRKLAGLTGYFIAGVIKLQRKNATTSCHSTGLKSALKRL
jgi:hypothetical protein